MRYDRSRGSTLVEIFYSIFVTTLLLRPGKTDGYLFIVKSVKVQIRHDRYDM